MSRTDGNLIIGTSVDTYGINEGLRRIEKSWSRLSKVMVFTAGIRGLVSLGSAALDAASNLQEVQNVVDTAFRGKDSSGAIVDMTHKIEAFADTCVEQFGMSEYAAKNTAGSFMAMGKSMGLGMEAASDMAVSLTALTGDFASFYNISQDYARVAMSAVYTGETETLKRYGIVLTEANLQQYALTQGLTESVKKMDAAEKAALRYNYIMQATADIQGDFSRTSGSWANQTRLLEQQWITFLNVLGSGLITVLTPVVRGLNTIVAALTRFAMVLGSILSNLFGVKWQSATGGAAEDMSNLADSTGGAADSAGDLAKNTKKAGKEAKKAQKSLMGFDEINRLNSKKDNAAGGSGGGGGGGGGGIGGLNFDLKPAVDEAKKQAQSLPKDIRGWYDLGMFIGNAIADSLASINWNKIRKAMANFGKNLAYFLNGFFSTDVLDMVGYTFGMALNSALEFGLNFATTFNWKQFGEKVASGINTFFRTFNWKKFGATIRAWAIGLWTFVKTTLANIDWALVFQSVKNFFSGLGVDGLMSIFGLLTFKTLLSGGFVKIFKGLGSIAITALKPFFNKLRIYFANNVGKILKALGTPFKAIGGIFKSLGITMLKGLGSVFKKLGSFIVTHAASIGKAFGGIGSIVAGLYLAISSFLDMWNNGFSVAKAVIMTLGAILTGIGVVILTGLSPAIAAIGVAVTAFGAILAVVIKGNLQSIKNFGKKIGSIAGKVFNFLTGTKKAYGATTKDGEKKTNNFKKAVVAKFKQVLYSANKHWRDLKKHFADTISNMIKKIKDWKKNVVDYFGKAASGAKDKWKTIKTWFYNKVTKPILDKFKSLKTKIVNTFKNAVKDSKAKFKGLSTWFKTNVTEKIKSKFKTLKTNVVDAFKNIWSSIKSGLKDAVNNFFSWITGKASNTSVKVNTGTTGSITSRTTGVQMYSAGIPELASGAVIPPNQRFLAVLGDQKRGTNIEAPLDTIRLAVAEDMRMYIDAMMQGFGEVVDAVDRKNFSVKIGDRTIGQANDRYRTRRAYLGGGL